MAQDRFPSPIPGDPFPWAPDPKVHAELEDPALQEGVTNSPATADDLSSYDLGGGD
jgi:hypothetical protein